ncbi:hypothetical protein F5884DRAFT_652369, partial [Xylogone sp. PMI_703]
QLLSGLSYIHEKLFVSHGNISCGAILLNLEGTVKIANIGESLLQNRKLSTQAEQHDVQSVGYVMIELMEPSTYILDPRSTELKNPEEWKDE